jgi:hypothetical protein
MWIGMDTTMYAFIEYDRQGRVTKQGVWTEDRGFSEQVHRYDKQGNPLRFYTSDPSFYSNKVVAYVRLKNVYNRKNQLVKVIPLPGNAPKDTKRYTSEETYFRYDERGNPIEERVVAQKGKVLTHLTTRTFDAQNRLLTVASTFEDSTLVVRKETYTYDDYGNLLYKKNCDKWGSCAVRYKAYNAEGYVVATVDSTLYMTVAEQENFLNNGIPYTPAQANALLLKERQPMAPTEYELNLYNYDEQGELYGIRIYKDGKLHGFKGLLSGSLQPFESKHLLDSLMTEPMNDPTLEYDEMGNWVKDWRDSAIYRKRVLRYY